jgi:hypothetical protein
MTLTKASTTAGSKCALARDDELDRLVVRHGIAIRAAGGHADVDAMAGRSVARRSGPGDNRCVPLLAWVY